MFLYRYGMVTAHSKFLYIQMYIILSKSVCYCRIQCCATQYITNAAFSRKRKNKKKSNETRPRSYFLRLGLLKINESAVQNIIVCGKFVFGIYGQEGIVVYMQCKYTQNIYAQVKRKALYSEVQCNTCRVSPFIMSSSVLCITFSYSAADGVRSSVSYCHFVWLNLCFF